MPTRTKSTPDRSRSQGAYAAAGGDGHRKRRGWLWWLLALLALLLLGALLLGLLGGGDDGKELTVQSVVKNEGFWVGSSQRRAGTPAATTD